MFNALIGSLTEYSVAGRIRRSNLLWILWFVAILGVTAFLGLILLRWGPNVSLVVWIIYFLGIAAIFYKPRYGVYIIIFLTLVGDGILAAWYPFTKNFSSPESLLYLHDAVIISPLESYIVFIFISWLGRETLSRRMRFYRGPLFWPALIFLAFVTFGLGYGIVTGGNVNIALWESRAIYYLVMLLIITGNLLETREHVSHFIWFVMLALFIEGVSGSLYFLIDLQGSLAGVDAITEHSAAVHMNSVFVFAFAIWLYKGTVSKRMILPLMVPFVLLAYLATQRRAAMVGLMIALVFLAVFLFWENRRVFWIIIPPIAFAGLVYLVLFWNQTGALGLPAQAVKSVIAPNQASIADQSSNIYRMIENVNISFTIHQAPLTGVGFGHKFYILVPLPDISFFEWWEYLTHNSILWIWIKTGVGGFLALMFLIGSTVMLSARVIARVPSNEMRAIAVTMTLYIIMHFVYAYVDISWDTQSMVYVGSAMGVINALERIVSRRVPQAPLRWPWQNAVEPAPSLEPEILVNKS